MLKLFVDRLGRRDGEVGRSQGNDRVATVTGVIGRCFPLREET